MRGLAALAVILFHLDFIGPFAPSGYLAVDFFFLMSGAVITKAYEGRLKDGLSLYNFLIKRLVRLYPLYLLGFVIGLVRRIGQLATNHPIHLSWFDLTFSAVFNLLMLPSPVTGEIAPFNVPSWSLFFEILVNMIWAAALVKVSKHKLAIYVTLLGIALCFAVTIKGSAEAGWNWSEIHFGILRSCFGFSLGILLTRQISLQGARDSMWSPVAAIALCTLLVLEVAPQYRIFYDLSVILFCFPVIVYLAIAFDPPRTLKKISRVLGDMSYPVYMLHIGPMFTLAYFARKFAVSPFVWIPLFMLAICSISLYLARTYDPALRKYLRKFSLERSTKIPRVA